MSKSNKEQLSYVERLEAKGIHCSQHQTCHGCMALIALTREEVVWPVGLADPSMPDEELRRRSLFGKCDFGFPQNWCAWGDAVPLKPCPKQTISSKQAGELYRVLSGKTTNRNMWNCVNEIREIIDILKSEAPELLEVTFIESQLASMDRLLMKSIKIMQIPQPRGFVLRKWNASIGPYCSQGTTL